MKCVKCGGKLTSKTAVDWDISGSCRRFICPECAEEEGLLPNEPVQDDPAQSYKFESKVENKNKKNKSVKKTHDTRLLRILKSILSECKEIISESISSNPLDERMGSYGNKIHELAREGISILKKNNKG